MHDLVHHFWSHKVHSWLQGQSVGDLDVSTVIGNANNHCAQAWHLGCVARYQPLQPEYVLAPYLSSATAKNSSAGLDVDVVVFM